MKPCIPSQLNPPLVPRLAGLAACFLTVLTVQLLQIPFNLGVDVRDPLLEPLGTEVLAGAVDRLELTPINGYQLSAK